MVSHSCPCVQVAGAQEPLAIVARITRRTEPFDAPRPEDVVARIRDLGALFDKSPADAREVLKQLLDDGIQLHPLENGGYRARWTVRGGALFFAGTTKPRCKPRALKSGCGLRGRDTHSVVRWSWGCRWRW